MPLPSATGQQHTYRAHDRTTLLSEVSTVQLILLPQALVATGFSKEGAVLMINHTGYDAAGQDWGCDFFEQQFIREPLLGVPQQVKALFVGSPSQLLIPDEFYDEPESRGWLRALYPILATDWITEYHAAADGLQYRMAIPRDVHRLLARYFGHTAVLPLAAAHLYKPDASVPALAQCLIAGGLAFATLRKAGKLLWHKVFDYDAPEDIVWRLAHICREHRIPLIGLHVEATILCEAQYDLLPELETFFPKIKWATHALPDQGHWAPVIYAMQQLYACAL